MQRRAAERSEVQEEQKYKVVELSVVFRFHHHCVLSNSIYQERLEENNDAAEERTRKRR